MALYGGAPGGAVVGVAGEGFATMTRSRMAAEDSPGAFEYSYSEILYGYKEGCFLFHFKLIL